MKRGFAALAVMVVLFSAINAEARGLVIRGGWTKSNTAPFSFGNVISELKGMDFKNYNGWHLGLGYQTETMRGFSFQPEVVFNTKGSNVADGARWKLSYVEVPVNIQYGIDLLIMRPFLFVAPFVGFNVGNVITGSQNAGILSVKDNIVKNAKTFEYGLGLGAGLNLAMFQLSLKYSWNFGRVSSFGEYANRIGNLKNETGALELSVGLRF